MRLMRYNLAANIAAHAKSAQYDMVFTGKETIDYNGSGNW